MMVHDLNDDEDYAEDEDQDDDDLAESPETPPVPSILRAQAPLSPTIPVPKVDAMTEESTVQENDIAQANRALEQLNTGWERAADVDDICKMTMMTIKAVEFRRRVLNMPFRKEVSVTSDRDDDTFEDDD